jgi:hypothetical protein
MNFGLPVDPRGLGVMSVDDCNYVRHSPAYKPMRCGSLQLCESFSQLTNLRESP